MHMIQKMVLIIIFYLQTVNSKHPITLLKRKMPIHAWNFYRAVGTGADLKCWNEDNPQVEEGRDGGNPEFEDGVSDQYEDEIAHMMRRLRLNFYRAEDAMFIMRKRQWAKEDEEFAKEQKRRAKEKRDRLIKKNKARRLKKDMDSREKSKDVVKKKSHKKMDHDKEEEELKKQLRLLLVCPVCSTMMPPPEPIYQCRDGHTLCKRCRFKLEGQVQN